MIDHWCYILGSWNYKDLHQHNRNSQKGAYGPCFQNYVSGDVLKEYFWKKNDMGFFSRSSEFQVRSKQTECRRRWKVILKWIAKNCLRLWAYIWLWIQFNGGLFDRNLDSIKIRIFLGQMTNYQHPQNDSSLHKGDSIDSEGFNKHY